MLKEKSVTMTNILSSFQVCGLNPYNPDIIPDHLFTPSLTTNNLNFEEPTYDTNILSEEQNEVIFPSTEDTEDNMNNKVTVADLDTNFQTSSSLLSPMPSCLNTETNLNTENISQIIQTISPLPSCSFTGPRKSNKNRSTGTQVLTKSPLIKQLKEKQNEKKDKELKKSMKNKSKNTRAVIKNSPIKNTKKKQEEKVIRKSKILVNRKLFLDVPTKTVTVFKVNVMMVMMKKKLLVFVLMIYTNIPNLMRHGYVVISVKNGRTQPVQVLE